jgi:hypothetical protein
MMILLISLICLAVHVVLTWDDMILQPLGDKLSELLPEKIRKPMYECLPCMGAWYGAAIWLICSHHRMGTLLSELLGIHTDIGLIPTVLASIGANALLLLLITFVRSVQALREMYELVNGIEPNE